MYEAPNFIFTPWGPRIAVGGSASAKKVAVGGKLGIVKDPFGTPQYLGATLPLDGYGIVNLCMSEDGKVLLGQLKGGYSANIFDSSQQKPSQSHAWDVKALIDAALAMPEADRMSKHITLPSGAEQLVENNTAPVAGTYFDPENVEVAVEGRMGDIIEVANLKRLVAHALLELPAPSNNLTPDEIAEIESHRAKINEIMANLGGFEFVPNEKEQLAATAADAKFHLVPEQAAGQAFGSDGLIYLAPNITASDMAKLRQGGVLEDKKQDILLSYKLFRDVSLGFWSSIQKGTAQIKLTVSAKDYATDSKANIFFGDRPLDNPGYSSFNISSGVTAGSTNLLDVYRVEQRLKYLGYGQSAISGSGEIVVDGHLNATTESIALRQFEQIVQGRTQYGNGSTPVILSPNSIELGWLNAYNAPHWMQYASAFLPAANGDASSARLNGWANQAGAATMGTSWIYDLMVAAQNAAREQGRTKPLWFAGTGDLGAQLKLGINTTYISRVNQGNQEKVDGKDIILGLAPATSAENRWDYAKATALANSLLNPNLVNVVPGTNNLKAVADRNPSNAQGLNRQDQALLDFVAIYTATQNESQNSVMNGSLEEQISNIHSTTDTIQRGQIQQALFGGGGLINTNVLLGGKGLALGSQVDAASLGTAMGNKPGVNYANWTGPLQAAMLEFGINTPQRIAAFLAQVKRETAGLAKMSEDIGPYRVHVLLDTFVSAYTDNGVYAVDSQKNSYTYTDRAGTKVVAVLTAREARFLNLQKFVKEELLLNDLDGYLISDLGMQADRVTYKALENLKVRSGSWDQTKAKQTANRHYSKDVGNGARIGNGTEASGDGWNFIGRGFVHLTGRSNYTPFANYIATRHPELVVQAPGKTIANSLLDNMAILSEDTPNGRLLSALMGTWFWVNHPNQPSVVLNTVADNLPGDPSQVTQTQFDAISMIINRNDTGTFAERFNSYKAILTAMQNGGNPYENQREALKRLGITAKGADGYNTKFGISLAARTPVNITSSLTAPALAGGLQSMTAADALAAVQKLSADIQSTLAVDTSGINLTIADLAGSTLGQTFGTNVALDNTAAGHNWFIDTTPGDNSEFLPTSNPNEWVAKEGSAAAGKMDMLSVLLHEYGHALGIEHSADSHDYMGTTLQAGVRRMPSAAELALMQELIGQAKVAMTASATTSTSTAATFATVPQGSGTGTGPQVAQYAVAANATLTNGSLNAADGWATQGGVDIANGAATLREVSASQTRLSQVFMVNDRDRFLSFTLSGTALDNLTGAPDDAFEVALLDANTGASLLGGTGLTRSDAFLNLQADGTQNLANCVTCINNADGSRTYRVDLAGIAAGTAVNLSFDLIGFGQNGSHVTVRDVRLSGLPQLHDEAATMLEDGALAFNPFAQVDNAALLMLGSHVVDQPAHGAVTVNADGTFSYTPAADYFGTDTFTYRLSDGPLESNLATVSLTITPVNDAPVVADVQATTAEDTALVIALGAYATDVDSTALTTQIVAGPTHGVLTQNADGSYTYTPDANYNGADSFTYLANDGALDSNIATVSLNVTAVNDVPTLGDLSLAAVEDTALAMNLLAQATDIDGDVLTASIVAGAQHGQVAINADGSFTYTPDLNFNGVDSFTYKVNDGALDSNIATVTLAVAAVNDAPVAADAAVTTAEDTALVIDLYAYATDVDTTLPSTAGGRGAGGEGSFTATIVTVPAHGVLTQNADGSYTYTPDANYNGADSFTYLVNDGALDSNIATVTLAITAVNDAPTLGDLNLAAVEDTALAMNLLAQATDIEGDPLTAAIVAGPLHGQISINADGSFTYTPELNFNGADSFTYKVNDGQLDSNIATVTLTIAAVNDAPVAADAAMATLEDTALVIDLRTYATDVDSTVFTARIVTGPAHGVLTQNVDGTFSYIADANYNGADSFTYLVNDGALDSNIATVTLAITSVNDAPQGANATVTTLEDTPYVFQVTDFGFADAIDAASNAGANNFANVIISGLPQAGMLTHNGAMVVAGQSISVADIAAGLLQFAPAANANGAGYANFTFQVQDDGGVANGGVNTDPVAKTLTLDVTSVNDAPVGTSTSVSTLEDTPYVFQVADFGYSDAVDAASTAGANNFASVMIGALPQAGSLTLNGVAVTSGQSIAVADIAAGLLQLAPAANANGTGYANFTFQVQDDGGVANGGINTDPVAKTLTLDVTSVNDAPVGTSTTVSTLEDTPYVFQVADFGYSDAQDAGSTAGANNFANVIIGNLPLVGSLTLNGVAVTSGQSIAVADIAAGLLQLAPVANANGTGYANFTFQVQDDGGVVNGGVDIDQTARTMTIDVTAVNDAPVATDVQASGYEDIPLNLNLLATASDVDGDALTPVIIAGPLHGQLVSKADGTFDYVSDLNYAGTDSFTYKVNDGSLDSNIVTVSLTVAAVNDAPVALSSMVAGLEDTPYVFTWSDFRVSDVDSVGLGITINTLPADGLLQYFDGLAWTNVAAGQRISKTDIDACLLCFNPDANESGFEGYTTAGTGNNLQNYASFTYQADDGFLSSAVASMTVNILPAADAPSLALTALAGASGATATRFSTSWESAPNRSHTFTILPRNTLEGWNVVKEAKHDDDHHHDHHDDDKGQGAFILWSSGDKMLHAKQDHDHHTDGKDHGHDDHKPYAVVQAAAGNGNNWLELGDAMGMGHQTYGIERAVETRAGISYQLSLDYAGRLGYDMAHTRIGIYVDGVQIGTHASTSPNTALNWETLTFNFTGNGAMQNIRIVMEGTASEKNGRGAMIDDIVLTEVMPINTGYQDGPIRLSGVLAALTDTDGSETLAVTVGAIPAGATLSDGTHSFTATDSLHLVAVTDWDLANLSITAPAGFTGSFALTVAASSTETATNETANYAVSLPVTVVAPIVEMSTAEHEHHGHHHEQHHEHDDVSGDKCGNDADTAQKNSATMTLHSEHTQQKAILGFPINGASTNSGYGDQGKREQSKPITDWSASSGSSILDDESRKGSKVKQTNNWLSDFLGVDKDAGTKQDAASLTKLSVTLKKGNTRLDS
jgi:VCBS repeat-containing protein